MGSKTPIFKQIVNQIAKFIYSERLKEGDPLPSVREVAEQLLINPNTVVKAFQELSRDGLIFAHQGKGYFVAKQRKIFSPEECERRLNEAISTFLNEALRLGYQKNDLINRLNKEIEEPS